MTLDQKIVSLWLNGKTLDYISTKLSVSVEYINGVVNLYLHGN